ncbi:MAG: dockerin type I domain-containing protein [Phycisphaerae bacterium]
MRPVPRTLSSESRDNTSYKRDLLDFCRESLARRKSATDRSDIQIRLSQRRPGPPDRRRPHRLGVCARASRRLGLQRPQRADEPKKFNNTTPGDTTNPDTSAHRYYSYDAIGNRIDHADGAPPPADVTYASNALNQYTQLDPSDSNAMQRLVYDADGNLWQSYMAGDANGDGVVDSSDLGIMFAYWQASCSAYSGAQYDECRRVDDNGDGVVNENDLGALLSMWDYAGSFPQFTCVGRGEPARELAADCVDEWGQEARIPL